MGLGWNDIKNKGVVTVYKGKLKHEHVFNTLQLRRLFGSRLSRELWASRLDYLLREGPDTNIPK